MLLSRRFSCLALAFALSFARLPGAELPPELGRITADSLRGHVSFLASDLLEGRNTPSRGLDIAAEYIAAQFRRAGLEPAGGDSYFQVAHMVQVTPDLDALELTLEHGGKATSVPADDVLFANTQAAIELDKAPVFKLAVNEPVPEAVRGKVAAFDYPQFPRNDEEGAKLMREMEAFRHRLDDLKPALVIAIRGGGIRQRGPVLRAESVSGVPYITVRNPELADVLRAMHHGPVDAALTIKLRAPRREPLVLRNIAGLLRGSDASLKDTYILVTAHYDHLGTRPGEGDQIFNGANDDASGTASMMELAAALSSAPQRPRRSILFLAFFGEEKGLLGSRYYVAHPLFPLARTIADVNLEHLGRTDDNEGPQNGSLNITGFDYSDLHTVFEEAGRETGVKVLKRGGGKSDLFFAASDNLPFADAGIPAHTLSVGYIFPDYHQPGDEWPKLDYANMCKVDRTIADGIRKLADSAAAPRWDPVNPKAERFRAAGREPLPTR